MGLCFGIILAYTYEADTEPSFINILRSPSSYTSKEIALPIQAIFFQVLAFQCAYIIIRISVIFNRLGSEVTINLLDLEPLEVFGKLASSTTSAIVVGIMLIPLLWIGDPMVFWTDIRAIIAFWLPVTVLVLLLPIFHISRRLRAAKTQELELIQQAINGRRLALEESCIAASSSDFKLPDLIAFREHLKSINTLLLESHFFRDVAVHGVIAGGFSAVGLIVRQLGTHSIM
jgi:hypothetical protein